jgi:hypothetical protein
MEPSNFISVLDRFLKGELEEATAMRLMDSMEQRETDAAAELEFSGLKARKEQQLIALQKRLKEDAGSDRAKPAINWVRQLAIGCFILLFASSFYFYVKPSSLVHRCTEASLRVQQELTPAMLAAFYVQPDKNEEGADSFASCVNTTEEGYLRFESVRMDTKQFIHPLPSAGNQHFLVFEETDMKQLLTVLTNEYKVDFQITGELPDQQFSGFISTGLNIKMVLQLLVSSGLFEASLEGKKILISART